MTIYHVMGDAFVTRDELNQRAGEILEFAQKSVSGLQFQHGLMTIDNVHTEYLDERENRVPFEPIGKNRPLTVQIRHVYTGRNPQGKRRTKRNMLLTSAMKSIAAFEAAPRAINFLSHKIGPKHNFSQVAATEQGTPLIYYSPALTQGASVLTLEVGFDDFDDDVITELSSFLLGAGGIPAFLAHSTYLLGAGLLLKLAGEIAARLLEHPAALRVTDTVDFVTPGTEIPLAGFKLFTPSDFPGADLHRFRMNSMGQLVDEDEGRYDGEFPYISISLDGTERPDFRKFEPTQASAAVLEDFFAIREGQEFSLEPLLTGLRLYNDLKFRLKADEVARQLREIEDKDSPEYERLSADYEAYVKNILEDVLKPLTT